MSRIYEVTFYTKRGIWRKYKIHATAKNMKEAKEYVKTLWYGGPEGAIPGKPHMFDIGVKRVIEEEQPEGYYLHTFTQVKV